MAEIFCKFGTCRGKIETTVKEKALVTYVQQDWTEGAAVLLAAGRKKEGGKKARYEFE